MLIIKRLPEFDHWMREFFGPGWRMYYAQHGDVLVVMLGGGEKVSQVRDIAAARKLAAALVF